MATMPALLLLNLLPLLMLLLTLIGSATMMTV